MTNKIQVQEELNPQTVEEANRIIEALKARITWKEQEKERLQSDRETLSEEIARREVADAISQQPYSEAEKKKAWNALNAIDMQIGQADVTLARLRERLDQAERELAEIEMQGKYNALKPMCDQIRKELAELASIVAQITPKADQIKSAYLKYNLAVGEYIELYRKFHTTVTGTGEDEVIAQPSYYDADRTLPASSRNLSEGLASEWFNDVDRLISPHRNGFMKYLHDQFSREIEAQESSSEAAPNDESFDLDEDEVFDVDAGEQSGS